MSEKTQTRWLKERSMTEDGVGLYRGRTEPVMIDTTQTWHGNGIAGNRKDLAEVDTEIGILR